MVASNGTTHNAAPRRDDAEFRAAVGQALGHLEDGAADKVVLARTLDVTASRPFDREDVRAAMRTANPAAYVFDVELPGDQGYLIGASPELLVSVRDGRLRSQPLAGSAPRSSDPVQDRANAEELLASEKDLREHSYVVDAIRDALRDHVDSTADLDVPTSPSLVATSHLWHLGTTITAQLSPGTSVLDVVYALHPTPAVCGHPRAAARELIESLEGFDRGYYTGLVGWADQAGNGEWAIILRCGILHGADVTLFAGAGIVTGSTPEGEHAETAVKFSTLLDGVTPVPDDVAARYRAAGYWTGQPLGSLLKDTAREHPRNVAVIDGGRSSTYAQLDAAADALAHGLAALGLRRGDRVVVHLPNTTELIEVLFALGRLGVVPVLALVAHRRSEVEFFAAHTEAVALVTIDTHAGFDHGGLAREVADAVACVRHVVVVTTAGRAAPGGTCSFEDLRRTDLLAAHGKLDDAAHPDDVVLLQLSGGPPARPSSSRAPTPTTSTPSVRAPRSVGSPPTRSTSRPCRSPTTTRSPHPGSSGCCTPAGPSCCPPTGRPTSL